MGSGQRTHRTPVGGRAGARRVARREQHQQLVRRQPLSASLRHRGPPGKTTARESLVTKPITLAVVHNYLERRPFAIAEDEHGTGEGILLKGFLAKPSQAIDAAAKVGRSTATRIFLCGVTWSITGRPRNRAPGPRGRPPHSGVTVDLTGVYVTGDTASAARLAHRFLTCCCPVPQTSLTS